jgi:hypothetical protein
LLIISGILSLAIKLIVLISFLRIKFPTSRNLGDDLSYSAATASRWINQFWDIIFIKKEEPHHSPGELIFAAIRSAINCLFFLIASIFVWK